MEGAGGLGAAEGDASRTKNYWCRYIYAWLKSRGPIGTIQDATFIEAGPGSSKKPRRENARTRRSRDGTWTKKGEELHFGYKLNSNVDIDYSLLRSIEPTTP